ncbi:MAG TPA: glycosyltransferase family 1 protein [Alphaproteobacteria bacterium]|nr:glycosyltransferase family 1 protein [Alphaproteobacteria bacterium]
MRILLVTDAWYPQVNGVVRTLDTVAAILRQQAHAVHLLTPQGFATLPCPTYPEIRLSLFPGRRVARVLDEYATGAIHIATEGPLGIAARRICLRRGLPFTTSFHTRFPEYVNARIHIPVGWLYAWLRRFHNSGAAVMVATPTLHRELAERGFENIRSWNRGVDTHLFRPRDKSFLDHLPRPIWLNVGRVAVEKNIEAFLALPLDGTKLVVGDGPQLAELKNKYPYVRFAGAKRGEELARFYSASDVFVFPSRTDTFGLVILEALASGLPVAALPVAGPVDVIGGSRTGILDEDLAKACRAALEIPPERCVAYAQQFSWEACARQFLENLYPASQNDLALATGD